MGRRRSTLSSPQNVAAGVYTITLGSDSSAANLNCFCVDYSNNINPGDKTTADLNDITGAKGLVTATYNTASASHTQQANANAVAYLVDKYLASSVSKTTAAEVNIAIDGSDGLPFQTPQANTPEPGLLQLEGVTALVGRQGRRLV